MRTRRLWDSQLTMGVFVRQTFQLATSVTVSSLEATVVLLYPDHHRLSDQIVQSDCLVR